MGTEARKCMSDHLEQATVNQYQCGYWELNQGLLQEQQVLLFLNFLLGLLNYDEIQNSGKGKIKQPGEPHPYMRLFGFGVGKGWRGEG